MNREVWRTSKAGAISRLKRQTEGMGSLASGHVRVKVKSIGLNFADIFALTGLYSATPQGSFIPGLEFAGVIEETTNDSSYEVGDRVMGVTRFGGYASVIDIEPHYVLPLPNNWSFQQGASYLVQTLTAYYGLTDLGALKPNHRVLIHSAAGGVGLQAMKLVKALGGKPVGTVRSDTKRAFLSDQGFDQVIVRKNDFEAQLKNRDERYDLILDGIGGVVQKSSFKYLNPMGRLVVFGAAEFTPDKSRPNYLSAVWRYLNRPKYDVMDMISDNKSVMAFNLIWLWEQVDYLSRLMATMQEIQIDPPYVGHEYRFEHAHDAIHCLRNGESIGKVVLNVD